MNIEKEMVFIVIFEDDVSIISDPNKPNSVIYAKTPNFSHPIKPIFNKNEETVISQKCKENLDKDKIKYRVSLSLPLTELIAAAFAQKAQKSS